MNIAPSMIFPRFLQFFSFETVAIGQYQCYILIKKVGYYALRTERFR